MNYLSDSIMRFKKIIISVIKNKSMRLIYFIAVFAAVCALTVHED